MPARDRNPTSLSVRRRVSRPQLKRSALGGDVIKLLRDIGRGVGLYFGGVVGGTALFMILAPVVCYLNYSVRPGPGWESGPVQLSWDEFLFHLDFLGDWLFMFLAPSALIVGLVVFAVVRAAERLRVRPAIVRIVGGFWGGTLTFYLLASAGWIISLGLAVGVWGTVIGTGVGACCLPRRPERIAA